MGILEHVWGVSSAQDRVWAHVSGISPRKAGASCLVVLQAFIDESVSPKGMFVLAGHIATAEAWACFAKDWEELLPYAVRDKNGEFNFKMKDMALSPDRMSRVPAFYKVIEKYALLSVSCAIDLSEVQRAKERIHVPNLIIDWGDIDNTYMLAFRCLIDMLHGRRNEFSTIIPLDENVNFIFDKRQEASGILAAWNDYIAGRPDRTRSYYGAVPRFEDDKIFLPLQAADFWAWWVRKWHEEGCPQKKGGPDFGLWRGTRKDYPKLHISYGEDELVKTFIQLLRSRIGPHRNYSPLCGSLTRVDGIECGLRG